MKGGDTSFGTVTYGKTSRGEEPLLSPILIMN